MGFNDQVGPSQVFVSKTELVPVLKVEKKTRNLFHSLATEHSAILQSGVYLSLNRAGSTLIDNHPGVDVGRGVDQTPPSLLHAPRQPACLS